jgi:hypothetical protein
VLLAMGLCATTLFAGTALASAGTSSAIHDGSYSTNDFGAGSSYLTLIVAGNGRTIVGGSYKKSVVVCTDSTSLGNQDPNDDGNAVVFIALPRLALSSSGSFSFSGNATGYDTSSNPAATFSLPIKISAHFVKGHIVAKKTTAAIVTFSAPAVCETATPTRFLLKWDS